MIYSVIDSTPVFFVRVMNKEHGEGFATSVSGMFGGSLLRRRVIILDHPPTAGLPFLIEGLQLAGAEVHLRVHHSDEDSEGLIVARCRELSGDRGVMVTRQEYPTCSLLVDVGEFKGNIIITDNDPDGLITLCKSVSVRYDDLENDGKVFDDPVVKKTAQTLSPNGLKLFHAWMATSTFGIHNHDTLFMRVFESFAMGIRGEKEQFEALDRLAAKYEQRKLCSQRLATRAKLLDPAFRFLDISTDLGCDQHALEKELSRGVNVSGRIVTTGLLSKIFGAEIVLRCDKDSESSIDLADLASKVFDSGLKNTWRPQDGVIMQSPRLLRLSPKKWDIFRPILLKTMEKETTPLKKM